MSESAARPGGAGHGASSVAGPEPFTVGIPVLNEEAILVPNTERLLAFLDGLGREYEVIIGSNGSTDSTTALGVDLTRRFPRVSFFHLPQRGVGLTFREFIHRARYPLLVSVDMDLSVDLDFVRSALALLDTHDVVIGSKKLGNQKRSFVRKMGSDLFLRIARLLLGMTYEDYSIAAKAYRVSVLERHAAVIDSGSAYVLEITYLAQRDGGNVVEVPVQCEDWRTSKFNLMHEALYKYSKLFSFWFRTRRRS